jgi:hypothetical protein
MAITRNPRHKTSHHQQPNSITPHRRHYQRSEAIRLSVNGKKSVEGPIPNQTQSALIEKFADNQTCG